MLLLKTPVLFGNCWKNQKQMNFGDPLYHILFMRGFNLNVIVCKSLSRVDQVLLGYSNNFHTNIFILMGRKGELT